MPDYNNKFHGPSYLEQEIRDERDTVIGTIRIKPSSVQWKAKGKGKFLTVTLKKFTDWIEDPETKAKKTKS